eukprot:4275227-Pleurochrysis_carterae.AAC.1
MCASNFCRSWTCFLRTSCAIGGSAKGSGAAAAGAAERDKAWEIGIFLDSELWPERTLKPDL